MQKETKTVLQRYINLSNYKRQSSHQTEMSGLKTMLTDCPKCKTQFPSNTVQEDFRNSDTKTDSISLWCYSWNNISSNLKN